MIDRTIFERIHAELCSLEIDEIKHRPEPVFKGMAVESPIIPAGTYLYRARKVGPNFNKSRSIKLADLIYPRPDKAPAGRANRKSQPMFYCSIGKEAVFFEIQGLKSGDELILTFWQTTEQTLVNNIGYTQRVFEQLGAKRLCPSWSPKSAGSPDAVVKLPQVNRAEMEALVRSDRNQELRSLLSEQFAGAIALGEEHKYKITAAIAEAHLGTINDTARFGGLLYPSVRMWANGDNLALQPWFVDAHVRFLKAVHIRIEGGSESIYNITALDCAVGFDAPGCLKWLGRTLRWSVKPQQTAKASVKEGRDCYGDYETGADGAPLHWVVTDAETGVPIELE